MKKIVLFTSVLLHSAFLLAQTNISAIEVKNHLNQVVTVCDRIVDAKYLENSMTRPTLLNVGAAYPNHLLTIVINYEDRKNFPFNPEQFYLNKRVCVTGTVSDFKGKPQIIALTPAEIKVDESQARAAGPSAGTPARTGATTQPNITTTTNPNTSTTGTTPSTPANRTNTSSLPDTLNRTAGGLTSTNRGSTINTSSTGSPVNTTNPSGTGSQPNRPDPTGTGNQPSATNPVTSTNRGNTTNTPAGGSGTASTSATPPTNAARTASPTTGTASTTRGTNTTNPTSVDNSTASAYTIEIGGNLRVRSGPAETSSVIEVVKAGTEVTILGSANGWSRVSYERSSADQGGSITIEGYIKNSVLNSADTPIATNTTATSNAAKKAGSPDTKTTSTDAAKKAAPSIRSSDEYSITISSGLRVRSEPSESSDVLQVIPAGTVVSVIRSQNGWSYVSFPGSSGSRNQAQRGYIKNSVLK